MPAYSGAGKAYIFDGDTGDLKLTLTNPTTSGSFGVSVAAFGDDILVGDSWQSKVYLFDGENGDLLRTFGNPNHTNVDYFGWSISALNNTVLIGAVNDDTAGIDAGAAYLFDGLSGELVESFFNPNPAGYDDFGVSVAMTGFNAIIGSPGEDLAGYNAGAAYIYEIPEPISALLLAFGSLMLLKRK